jgi:selenide,water dikinase
MDPALLSRFLDKLPSFACESLLVGYGHNDDAGVYRLSQDLAVVSTVDFFPPMVDDGRLFGRIAAANALSDVYAMGGRPILALNLVCFPQDMDPSILGEILAGGAETLAEAGAALAGGHSIYDSLPKYGLAVTGLVHPDRIRRNHTLREGDALVLTKAVGTGLTLAAQRAGVAQEADYRAAVASMTRLNAAAAEAMGRFPVSAATDVTGFGILGHLAEMAGTTFAIYLNYDSIPVLPGALGYAQEFLATALGQRNRNHLAPIVDLAALSPAQEEILFDPQTSGGLAISLSAPLAEDLVAALKPTDPEAAIVGLVSRRGPNEPAIAVL